jgi:Glycosyl transferase family 1
VAYFVSAHGFGHATRACAVMAAVHALDAQVCFEIFTAAPEFVFRDSLTGPFVYHQAVTDVGLVQHSALIENLPATVARLDEFLPFDPFLVRTWADWLERLQCELVMCDIAPLGLVVAEDARLPAILIENFTWDFIYRAYLTEAPGLGRHADYLAEIFARARYRLQAEPFCVPIKQAAARLHPVGRRPRASVAATRARLQLTAGERLMLVTLGGVPDQPPLPLGVPEAGVVYALIGAGQVLRRDGPWLLLPHQSPIYYPDLLAASDAVIAKLGYSTLAEAYHAGVPFGFLPRARFPESPILADFAEQEMPALALSAEAFLAGDWLEAAGRLLSMAPRHRHTINGADRAAEFIVDLL